MSLAQLPEKLLAGHCLDDGICPASGEEGIHDRAGGLLDPEDGMHVPLEMDGQQLPGEISAIVDHYVPRRQGGQKVERGPSFIAVGAKVKRDRNSLRKLNQATEQALRVVARIRGRAIPATDQRPRQVEL